MAKDILEQNEIDSLLGMMTSGESEPDPEKEAAFSKECLDFIGQIFRQTARRMTKHFSYILEDLCNFSCQCAEAVTFEEFIRSIPNPSACFIIEWLGEKFVIQIAPGLAIQFLYGQLMKMAGKIDIHGHRDFTRLEIETMESRVILPILENIKTAFAEVAKRLPSGASSAYCAAAASAQNIPPYTKIEFQNNTCFVDAAMMQDMCIVVSMESNLFEEVGFIQICLPRFFVQKILC